MHGAAFAPAVSVAAAKQLGHHALEICTFGNRMPVATMRADNLVVTAQGTTHPYGNRFLANIGMHHPRNIAGMKLFHGTPVKLAYGDHLAIYLKQLLWF
jgi:hypothetical protein